MLQANSPNQLSLKYFRATALTVIATTLIPLLLMYSAYEDYLSPDWDPNGDSGVVQGFFIFFIAAATAVLFSAIAFPAAASVLQRQGRFSQAHFFRLLRVWLAILSFIVALIGAWFSGSLLIVIPLSVLLFCIVTLLTFPFAHLWLWLAKCR
jgi:hypothetical protein